MEYRREIDGLRAIAVLSIILFHAGFSAFPGGYFGVDIFFVISGYLITGILLRENASGTFTLAKFYERRARRILPALFLMLFVTSAVAYWLMLPFELRAFAQNVTAVVLFASNILFWQRAGFFDFYFDPPALLNPLLHTWSLGVEEQFYLVFPVLLLVAWRFGRRRAFQLVAVLALASFIFSSLIDGEWHLGFRAHREANFYLLPARAWQLMIGALIAFLPTPESRRRWKELAALAGLALMLWAIFFFHAGSIRYASIFALAPTIGAALILAFGRGTRTGAVLSSPPLVGVGLISYSAYLWHQPLFAFAHSASLSDDFTWTTSLALCATTMVLAWASWRWIETPFRNRQAVSRRVLVIGCTISAACLLAFGLGFALDKNPPTRGRILPGGLVETSQDRVKVMSDCGFKAGADLPGCAVGSSTSDTPAFVAIGDSHMAALLPAFQEFSRQTSRNGRLVTLAGCPPLIGRVYQGQAANCDPMQAAMLAFVKARGIKHVFMASRWAGYIDLDGATSRSAFGASVKRTIDAYRDIGVHIYIVEQVPQQRHRPIGLYIQAYFSRDPAAFIRRLSVTPSEHEARQSPVNAAFAPYRSDSFVTFIDPSTVLCADNLCPIGTVNQSFYWDVSHLSVAGAVRVSAMLESAKIPW